MYVTIIVLAIAIGMIIVEIIKPGRSWNKVKTWWRRALILNMVQVSSVYIAGIAWDKWFLGASLWNAEEYTGTNGGALLGYLVITFIYYWWHRLRHENMFLWNWFHQVHHSPQRIEIITSFYKHPIEILFNSMLSSFILYVLVGLGPESAAIAVLVTGIAELFYHWNVNFRCINNFNIWMR